MTDECGTCQSSPKPCPDCPAITLQALLPVKPRNLFWRPATDHPQDHSDADWIAFGFGGRYAIQKPKRVNASLRDGVKPGTTVLIDGEDHWKALLWWPEDEFTFATFDSVVDARKAAQAHYEAEFAKRIDDRPYGVPRDMHERGFVPPYITDRIAAETRLREALEKIAAYPRGGTISPGTPEFDRDEMIGIARSALNQSGDVRWQHVKRGSTYTEIGRGRLQCSANSALDDAPIVIYRGEDGQLWARGVDEFEDGRFVRI